MQKSIIYLFAALLFASCGGNSGKPGDQGATGQGQGSTENLAAQQEQAVKAKYLEKGREIANLTQAELLKVVQGAIASGGPVHAVEYCNIEALELKDSLSALNNCTIRRLSMKYRNPADRPVSETEKEQLQTYERLHGEGEALSPAVHIVGNEVEYYQPILIGAGACLLCHGEPGTQIADATLRTIRELYPEDKATGYALNDFRGVWKITFLY